VNPNNPLGEVYSPQLVLQLMEVCHRSGLVWLDFPILVTHIYGAEPCKILGIVSDKDKLLFEHKLEI
jgi:aspartate/methionine/tyrosine aminotransferase